MRKTIYKQSIGDRIFDIMNIILLCLVTFICIFPIYYTILASVSDPIQVLNGKVILLPKGFTIASYRNIFKNSEIWQGYLNSFVYTFLGTIINLAVTISCAYALSKKMLKGRNVIMLLFVFTMYFSGGIIPSYIWMKTLRITDTLWVMVLPGAMSVFNMIITRTFYQTSLPNELCEAAKIDGCSEFSIFFRIALPLSGAIIAVMTLYYAVGHWNSYFNALIYINNRELYPLQLVLRNILIMNQNMQIDPSMLTSIEEMAAVQKRRYLAETMKYSLIFVSSAPVLIAYPFVQKHFIKGVMIGAVKG